MKKIVKNILAGLDDAVAYAKGEKSRGVLSKLDLTRIDVKSIRKKTGLTREEFSQLFAIKKQTLQDWELNRKKPAISARMFLLLVEKHPTTARKTLRSFGCPTETKKPTPTKNATKKNVLSSKKSKLCKKS